MVNKKIERIDFVKKATELFNTKGYNYSSVEQIAQSCGLSKASVYHYVASKQKLAEMTLVNFHETVKKNVFESSSQKTTPEAKLQAFAESLKSFFADRSGGCLMGNLSSELIDSAPDFLPFFKNFFDDWINSLAAILAERLHFDKAKELAEDFLAQFQGALMLSRVYKNENILMRSLKQLSNLLANNNRILVS